MHCEKIRLALREGTPKKGKIEGAMNSDELKSFTTGATNSRRMVAGRIEYVKNALLA